MENGARPKNIIARKTKDDAAIYFKTEDVRFKTREKGVVNAENRARPKNVIARKTKDDAAIYFKTEDVRF